ncbi:unnamed protein product [Cunninghamella blakesleeana]
MNNSDIKNSSSKKQPISVPSNNNNNSNRSNNNDINSTISHSVGANTQTKPNVKRPRMTTFNTIHIDKYSHSLRDFPLHHFDCNLTVEKATFESPPMHQPNSATSSNSQKQSPITPSPTQLSIDNHYKNNHHHHYHNTENNNNHNNMDHDNKLQDSIIASNSTTQLSVASSSSTPIQDVFSNISFPIATNNNINNNNNNSNNNDHNHLNNHIPIKIPDKISKRQDTLSHSPPISYSSTKNKATNKNDVSYLFVYYLFIQQQKLPPVNGTATPSEVFHRNLVDAVSNVEDSDEYEQYVYPYSHHEQMISSTVTQDVNTKNKKQRQRFPILPSFRRSTAPSTSSLSLKQHHQESKGLLNDIMHQQRSISLYLPINSNYDKKKSQQNQYYHQHYDKNNNNYNNGGNNDLDVYHHHHHHHHHNDWVKRGRPKLRNHIMDHPRSSTSSYHHDLYTTAQPWRHEGGGSSSDDGFDDDRRYNERFYFPRRHPKYTQFPIDDDDDDDGDHLSFNIVCWRLLRNIMVGLIILLCLFFIVGFRAVPLKNVSTTMGNVLASDKELIFDLMLKANNWNWWTIRIQQADLSIFAFSQLVPLQEQQLNENGFSVDEKNKTILIKNNSKKDNNKKDTIMTPAELLGNCQYFDQPLALTSSGFLNGENEKDRLVNASTQIRIKSPGLDISGNQRWSRMIRYPYGLVNRGVIKYHPFPLFSFSSLQSISLCIVLHIDPISKTVFYNHLINENDDDHGYCSHYSTIKS